MSVTRAEQVVKACEIEVGHQRRLFEKVKAALESAEADLRSAKACLRIAVAAASVNQEPEL